MAQFPRREAEVSDLADNLISGLEANSGTYPSPPIAPAELRAALDALIAAHHTAVAAQAAATQAFADKKVVLETLMDKMKVDIRYAENTVDMHDEKLKLLGWSGRKAPTPLQAPGQARLLEAPREGEGWIFLDWKSPFDGGKVASYKVERRERSKTGTVPSERALARDGTVPTFGTWVIADMAMKTETTLQNQERGKEFEYRVIAVNKAGQGEPSNTVMAVL